MPTKIDWAEEVWNPITGCSKISEGCRNCYAEKIATTRLKGRCGYPADDPFRVTYHKNRVNQPFGWKKPRRIFVCSMGDLFHDDVEEWQLDRIFDRILYDGISHHTFIILTKRAKRMQEYCSQDHISDFLKRFPNVWVGISAENQKRLDERVPYLLRTPAAVRWVSLEPMIASMSFRCALWSFGSPGVQPLDGLKGIDWVVAGHESGPRARNLNFEWAGQVKDQCVAMGVPFFLKQWKIDGKMVKMPMLDGRVWDQYPEGV